MFVGIVGPPGAGKGTQSKRLVQHLHVPHLSTGDMLRQARRDDSPLGRLAADFMDRGKLVPDSLILDIVRQRMNQPDCQHGCLFDGFPRTVEQAESLDKMLAERNTPLQLMLELQTDEQELRRRMLERAKIEKRSDDTPETIAERFKVYRKQTEPLLEYYEKCGLLEPIDGMGSPDEVFERIRGCVERRKGAL